MRTMKNDKKILKIFLIGTVFFLILVIFLSNISITSLNFQTDESNRIINLSYNSERYAKRIETQDIVYWSFEGSNPYIDIIMLILPKMKYLEFNIYTDHWSVVSQIEYFSEYFVSKGSVKDSGRFIPPDEDMWYILFANVDPNQEATSLSWTIVAITVNSDTSQNFDSGIFFVLISTFIFIIILFIYNDCRIKKGVGRLTCNKIKSVKSKISGLWKGFSWSNATVSTIVVWEGEHNEETNAITNHCKYCDISIPLYLKKCPYCMTKT